MNLKKHTTANTQEQKGHIRLAIKPLKKKPAQFWRMINLYQRDGKRRVQRRKGRACVPKHTTSSVKHVEEVL